ncbi:MAG: glycosyltransferase [Planctomycetes bacterium]|nr:glycosyltransferase [Planctomycetota bacterium]MCC7396672.1 glycosyltransferase [Planctomycetota bacterium]
MKVLYVVHQYFPECYSGTEQYCLAVSREARRRGLDTTILSLWPDSGCGQPPLVVEDRPYDGCPVLRLRHWWGLANNEHLRDYQNPLVAARFRQVLRELQPDVVHFFHLRNLGSDLLQVAVDFGARTVVHLMDFWYLCPRFTLLRSDGATCDGPPDGGFGCIACHAPELGAALADAGVAAAARDFARHAPKVQVAWTTPNRFAALIGRREIQLERLARVDAVVAPSRFVAEMFARNGFPTDRVHVIGYGLEPGRVERRMVQRPRAPLQLAFAGVLSPWKGPQVAIQAVRATSAPVRLRIHGNTEEGMFAAHIASLRRLAGDDPRIEFCGPFGPDRLSDVMAATDVLVVPSLWYENTPFVMLEALAAGVPVAASALGGMTELIEEGQNGFVFPPGDAAALAQLIENWCREPGRLAGLDPQPTGTVAESFTRFERLYRS